MGREGQFQEDQVQVPVGHPCGDGEQVGRRTRQDGEGPCGGRQRLQGRGNGSEERGAP